MSNPKATIELHDGATIRVFSKLTGALREASINKITGRIIIQMKEKSEIIVLKNGKRPGYKAETWISCDC